MIVIYHNNRQVTRVTSDNSEVIDFDGSKSIASVLMHLAMQFPDMTIAWCHQDFMDFANWSEFPKVLHHDKIMVSFSPSMALYLGREIGYVEESPFIKVNKQVSYPTWQMSSGIGGIHTAVLLQFKGKIKEHRDFDYFLNSIAKLGMPLGLLCYSEPKLVTNFSRCSQPKASISTLFQFVYQHYKTRWLFLLLLNLMVYEKRLPIFAFLKALFYKKRNTIEMSLDSIVVQSNKEVVQKATIDVIIPTIGRKKYLYDVLKDLAVQTLLPKDIIIVEQNPLEGSMSELDYLKNEYWPFKIKHTFTHQAGACNARNLALEQVESEWVFMADDDVRIEAQFLEKGLSFAKLYAAKALTFGCYQANYSEEKKIKHTMQWSSFGSGCSIVRLKENNELRYDTSLEFGYGEDTEFGLQLRNEGIDVVFTPYPEILHLKAPLGGFRTQPVLQWHKEAIQPKPSPTVMYVKQKHDTQEQILGYKTVLFFKFYMLQNSRNPIVYLRKMKRQWNKSVFWANQLRNIHKI
ncbi:Glycosyltransferase, GT2 family [Flavobacterium succinicans]|uniref:Glycosyltransferase, GT2 family n=1 Tax=Flavobacterium succinicans TaxID=29536 RepID=A0A1I4SHM3_9FLAO|nr:glycosyltransferase [Flavobacterium succinicans]SFM63957.1 Glycosyltransferase, GT2 family [Flavobacterium succinicans]